MANDYYDHGDLPADDSLAVSGEMRAEFDLIQAGFDKIATPTGNANKVVVINAGATGQTVIAADALESATIHAATGKTTPVDADELGLSDSEATYGLKKITWANIKATLATWLDTLTATWSNKTLTSPTLTTPQINDTTADHQYIVAVSELTADRTVTLPLLTGNDEFVFKDHAQTLTNKTLTDPVLNVGGGTLVIPAATTPSQTAEGSVVWDSDNDVLTVGDGVGRKTLLDTSLLGAASGIATLGADSLIPLAQIPVAALERLVVVADQTARYALTTASVQNGDTVKQTDPGEFWYVIDDTNLGNSAGYSVYTAGTASAVALGGITGLGTGVATALAINVGSAGAPVVNGGALGTPSSGVTDNLTTATSVAAITDTDFVDITLAAGGKRKTLWTAVVTYLAATFGSKSGKLSQFSATTSAELAGVLSDETGDGGGFVRANNATLTGALVSATSTDDDNTLLLSDNKWVQRQIANSIFSKAQAQSVSLTAAASGSTGLTFADNANLDMGTNDFTPAAKVALPDYTPASEQFLFHKHDGTNGIILSLLTTGIARLTINASTYDSTVAIPATDGVAMLLFPVVVRETATTAGSVTFYFGGKQLGDAVAITAGAPTSVDNASPLYVMGTSAVRTAGRCYEAYLLNFALSSTQASLFAKSGVASSNATASQTVLNVSSCEQGSYEAGSGGFSATGGTWVTTASAGGKYGGTADEIELVNGAMYCAEFDFVLNSGASPSTSLRNTFGGAVYSDSTFQQPSTGHNILFYTATGSTKGVFMFNNAAGVASDFTVSNLSVKRVGAVLRVETSGINPTQLKDSSSNKIHGSYPASGSSLAFPMASGSYEWQTAIAADTTLTSIVPASFELEKMVFRNSTAGAVSVRLGTTAGGTDVFGLTALNTSATLGGFKTILCNQGFSITAAQTLYLSSTDWTGGGTPPSLTFTAFFRRIS